MTQQYREYAQKVVLREADSFITLNTGPTKSGFMSIPAQSYGRSLYSTSQQTFYCRIIPAVFGIYYLLYDHHPWLLHFWVWQFQAEITSVRSLIKLNWHGHRPARPENLRQYNKLELKMLQVLYIGAQRRLLRIQRINESAFFSVIDLKGAFESNIYCQCP